MIIKLGEDKSFTGKQFKKAEVKKMVQDYRATIDTKKELNFAHFTVKEILDLFIENGVIKGPVTLQKPDIGIEYGVKIYIGKHTTTNTCPPYREADYKDKNTTIICNTKVIGFRKYLDILDDTKAITIPIANDPGDGLDQATVCPPDCGDGVPDDGPRDGFDVGN